MLWKGQPQLSSIGSFLTDSIAGPIDSDSPVEEDMIRYDANGVR